MLQYLRIILVTLMSAVMSAGAYAQSATSLATKALSKTREEMYGPEKPASATNVLAALRGSSLAIDRLVDIPLPPADSIAADSIPADTALLELAEYIPLSVSDSLLSDSAAIANTGIVEIEPIPIFYTIPAVFDTYRFVDPDKLPVDKPKYTIPGGGWLERGIYMDGLMNRARQAYMLASPQTVRYNVAWLPEPPKKFEAVIDPSTQHIEFKEVVVNTAVAEGIEAPVIRRKNWIHNFAASLQFSQAYVSPNWYQGGNNNVNMLGQVVWNVKLNQKFYPKFLFENTVQYKVGMNSAPNDTLRNYSISEDIFQINTTLGYKAVKRWYYSFTMQFKTQLFNAYNTNSDNLRSAFLSPADLNVGLGMTYNYKNKKETVNFDASISPLSYNLKICTNDRMNPANFGIDEGKHTVSQYGSTAEAKLKWLMAYNITLQSRMYFFTDYEYLQADWENTISFAINRFLTTQIYVHMRYDTTTPRSDNPSWHKLQIREILSFGFTYKFATI